MRRGAWPCVYERTWDEVTRLWTYSGDCSAVSQWNGVIAMGLATLGAIVVIVLYVRLKKR